MEKLQYFCVEGAYSSLDTEKTQVFSAMQTLARKNPRCSAFSLRQAPVHWENQTNAVPSTQDSALCNHIKPQCNI